MHEGDAAKTIPKSGLEIVLGQIAFQPHTLLALAIEEEHSRRPNRIKAAQPCRMFLNVSFYRKEFWPMNSAVF